MATEADEMMKRALSTVTCMRAYNCRNPEKFEDFSPSFEAQSALRDFNEWIGLWRPPA